MIGGLTGRRNGWAVRGVGGVAAVAAWSSWWWWRRRCWEFWLFSYGCMLQLPAEMTLRSVSLPSRVRWCAYTLTHSLAHSLTHSQTHTFPDAHTHIADSYTHLQTHTHTYRRSHGHAHAHLKILRLKPTPKPTPKYSHAHRHTHAHTHAHTHTRVQLLLLLQLLSTDAPPAQSLWATYAFAVLAAGLCGYCLRLCAGQLDASMGDDEDALAGGSDSTAGEPERPRGPQYLALDQSILFLVSGGWVRG